MINYTLIPWCWTFWMCYQVIRFKPDPYLTQNPVSVGLFKDPVLTEQKECQASTGENMTLTITQKHYVCTFIFLHTSLSCTPLSKAYCTRPIAVSWDRAFRLYFVLTKVDILGCEHRAHCMKKRTSLHVHDVVCVKYLCNMLVEMVFGERICRAQPT